MRLAIASYAVAEVALFVLVVRWLGGWVTFLLVLATSLLGGWLIRNEGLRAFSALNAAVRAGRGPDHDVADTGMVLTGGLLLLLPGFVTDVAGLLIVAPATRPLARRLLGRVRLATPRWSRRLRRSTGVPPSGGSATAGPVVRGEIVDPDDEP
jgi:UPF0716 protein FxsA